MRDLLLLTAAAVLAGGYAAQTAAQSTPAAMVERGRERYLATGCWQCHGYEGQGGAGPRIGPNPTPLRAFIAYVRAPTQEMPPYREKVLPDRDLADIHAFLAARRQPVVLPGAAPVAPAR
jgi:mono/diheme cytochrome c family protein